MKNFELLRKDWDSFNSDRSAGSVIVAEVNTTEGVSWLSPIGQPEKKLTGRDIIAAAGFEPEEITLLYNITMPGLPIFVLSPISRARDFLAEYWAGTVLPDDIADSYAGTAWTFFYGETEDGYYYRVSSNTGWGGDFTARTIDEPLLQEA